MTAILADVVTVATNLFSLAGKGAEFITSNPIIAVPVYAGIAGIGLGWLFSLLKRV